MPILSVIYGKDPTNAINLTDVILEKFVKNDILFIPKEVDLNVLKYDPYPGEAKYMYITFCIGDKANTITVSEYRHMDIHINSNMEERKKKNLNNILIYPHGVYVKDDGGLNVMYNFAKILDEIGKNVRIYPTFGNVENPIFNKYYTFDFEIENSLIIYCEGTDGNPLNGKYVVRWMLSELGKNVKIDRGFSFGKKELIYYFNSEIKFEKEPEKMNKIYKTLSLIYYPTMFINRKQERFLELCYTYRKSDKYHKDIIPLHNDKSYNVLRYLESENYLELFNVHRYFVSYDPLTFLIVIAGLCGCISIVYPIKDVSEDEWLSMIAVKEYMKDKNIKKLYGIAYGTENVDWAIKTIHLVKKQWDDIVNYYKEKHVTQFLKDIDNFEDMQNTVENNFYGFDSYFIPELEEMKLKVKDILPTFEKCGDDDCIFNQINSSWKNRMTKLENYGSMDHLYWNPEYSEDYFYFIKKACNEKKITIKNPLTNELITSDVYFLMTEKNNSKYPNLICNYYFKENDIILGISLGTSQHSMHSSILYMISFENKKKILFSILNCDTLLTDVNIKKMYNYVQEIKVTDVNNYPIINKTIYGYHPAIGHNLCNDFTGIYIMNKINFINNMDELILGPNDPYYISNIIKDNNDHIKIIKQENIYNLEGVIGRGMFFKFNHYYITNDCIDYLKKHLNNINPITHEMQTELDYIKKTYSPIISINLRCGENIMIDQEKVIIEVINEIVEYNPRAYFLIDGFCGYEKEDEEDPIITVSGNKYSTILKLYEETIKNITEKINTKNYKSLINKYVTNTIRYLDIADVAIYQNNTLVLGYWLCNLPGIYFGRPYMESQKKVLDFSIENSVPMKYISDEKSIKFINSNTNEIVNDKNEHINRNYIISSDTILNKLYDFCIDNDIEINVKIT